MNLTAEADPGIVRRGEAYALMIEARAKMRLEDEYHAAQERGEVRGSNTGRSISALKMPFFGDAGLSAKDIHEALQVRNAEEADPGRING